jgi:ppGpp synthetase/RelA/SpoT-type nucleotidyltranferase
VLVHTDDQAIFLCEAFNARAFVYDNNIFFNEGEFDPSSDEGKKLIVHELTHIIQQSPEEEIKRQVKTNQTNTIVVPKEYALDEAIKIYQFLKALPLKSREEFKRKNPKLIQKVNDAIGKEIKHYDKTQNELELSAPSGYDSLKENKLKEDEEKDEEINNSGDTLLLDEDGLPIVNIPVEDLNNPSPQTLDRWSNMSVFDIVVLELGYSWKEVNKAFMGNGRLESNLFIKQKILEGWRLNSDVPVPKSWSDEKGFHVMAWTFSMATLTAGQAGLNPKGGQIFIWETPWLTGAQRKACHILDAYEYLIGTKNDIEEYKKAKAVSVDYGLPLPDELFTFIKLYVNVNGYREHFKEKIAEIDKQRKEKIDAGKKAELDKLNEQELQAKIKNLERIADDLYKIFGKTIYGSENDSDKVTAALEGLKPEDIKLLKEIYYTKYSKERKGNSLERDILLELWNDKEALFSSLKALKPKTKQEGGKYITSSVTGSKGVKDSEVKYNYYLDKSKEMWGDRLPYLRRWLVGLPNGKVRSYNFEDSLEFDLDQVGTYEIFAIIQEPNGQFVVLRDTLVSDDLNTIALQSLPDLKTIDSLTYRGKLEEQIIDMSGGVTQDQKIGTTYISTARANPTTVGYVSYGTPNTFYTLHPSAGAKSFDWYVYCKEGEILKMKNYYGFEPQIIKGRRGFRLSGNSNEANFPLFTPDTYIICCDEKDENGEVINTVHYVHVVLKSKEELERIENFRKYIDKVDENSRKIKEENQVTLKATYVNKETGNIMSLPLYLGKASDNSGDFVMLDLLPGPSDYQREYRGKTIGDVWDDFNDKNEYPKGEILIQLPANKLGLAGVTMRFITTGQSFWQEFSSKVGWASLGFAAAGVVALFIPGGQVVAPYLFVMAATAGAISSGASLYNRFQKPEINGVGVAIDVLGLAASIVGGATAFRTITMGAKSLLIGTGRYLVLTGFAIDGASAILMASEYVIQINDILNSKIPANEKIAAIVKIISMMALMGALLALGIKDMKKANLQLTELLGEAKIKGLSLEQIAQLSNVDESILVHLKKVTETEFKDIARLLGKLSKGDLEEVVSILLNNPEVKTLYEKYPATILKLAEDKSTRALLGKNHALVEKLMTNKDLKYLIESNVNLAKSMLKHPEALPVLEDAIREVDQRGAKAVVMEGEGELFATKLKDDQTKLGKEMNKDFATKARQPDFDINSKNDKAYVDRYVKDLYLQTKQANEDLKKMADAIISKNGGKLKMRQQPKAIERVEEKLIDYEQDASKLTDLSGCIISYDSLDDIYKALKQVNEDYRGDIAQVKDRFISPEGSGYRDILINVRTTNGHIAEFRLHLSQIDAVAEIEHSLYEVKRGKDAVLKATKRPETLREQAISIAITKRTRKMFKEALLKEPQHANQ